MSVQISASWTKDTKEFNGLERIEKDLIAEPLYRRYAVVLLETIRVTRDITAGGTETPTVRVVQIEAVDGDDEKPVRELLERYMKDRTGNAPDASLFDGRALDDPDDPADRDGRREDEA